jgi:hypothetical protein
MGARNVVTGSGETWDRRRPDHVRLMHNLVNAAPGGGARCDGNGPASLAPAGLSVSSRTPTRPSWPGTGEYACPRKIATHGVWPHIDVSAALAAAASMPVGVASAELSVSAGPAIADMPVIDPAAIGASEG